MSTKPKEIRPVDERGVEAYEESGGGISYKRSKQIEPVEIASERGHWYDSKTGKQVIVPRGMRIAERIAAGLVPGTTTIQDLAAKHNLTRWKVNKAIVFTADIVDEEGWPNEMLQAMVWERLDADSADTTGAGSELHKAIEQFIRDEQYDEKWTLHLNALRHELAMHNIDLKRGNPEHTFATPRYGGKVDWHDEEWLLDFKSKREGIYKDGKLIKLSYPNHWQQLAAYHRGLWTYYKEDGRKRRLANVFVGIPDAAAKLIEVTPTQAVQGWDQFCDLLSLWWHTYDLKQYV